MSRLIDCAHRASVWKVYLQLLQQYSIAIAGVIGLVVALVLASSARATVVFETGFEQPTYSTGAVRFQDGWGLGGLQSIVQTAVVKTGAQALDVNPFATTELCFRSASVPVAGQTMTIEADLRHTGATGAASNMVLASDTGPIGYVTNTGNGFQLINFDNTATTFASFPDDVWYHISWTIDFTALTMSASVDGTPLGSLPITTPSPTVTTDFGFSSVLSTPQQHLYVDNISIVVPEPTSLGLLTFAAFALKRRRVHIKKTKIVGGNLRPMSGVAGLLVTLVIAPSARAALYEFSASGTTSSNVVAALNNQPSTFSLVYDTSIAPTFDNGSLVDYDNSAVSATITIGGVAWHYGSTSLDFHVQNNLPGDQFIYNSAITNSDDSAYTGQQLQLIMVGDSTFLSSTALPTTIGDLNLAGASTLIYRITGGTVTSGGGTFGTVQVNFTNPSIAAIPEPASLGLIGIGTLGLVRRRRA